MWLPQIFAAINEYHISQGYDSDFCTMVEAILLSSHPNTSNTTCVVVGGFMHIKTLYDNIFF